MEDMRFWQNTDLSKCAVGDVLWVKSGQDMEFEADIHFYGVDVQFVGRDSVNNGFPCYKNNEGVFFPWRIVDIDFPKWSLCRLVEKTGVSERNLQRKRKKYNKFKEYLMFYFEHSSYYRREALKAWLAYEFKLSIGVNFFLEDMEELLYYMES